MGNTVTPSVTELSLSARFTPQERLAASRKALVRHMSRDARPHHQDTDDNSDHSATQNKTGQRASGESVNSGFSSSTLRILKRGLRTWWRHHPANFAVSVAKPLLGRYASQSPFRLLAISAGIGAALVVIKPWRLVSMGGIALATLKSSEFSGLLMSMLSTQPEDNELSS